MIIEEARNLLAINLHYFYFILFLNFNFMKMNILFFFHLFYFIILYHIIYISYLYIYTYTLISFVYVFIWFYYFFYLVLSSLIGCRVLIIIIIIYGKNSIYLYTLNHILWALKFFKLLYILKDISLQNLIKKRHQKTKLYLLVYRPCTCSFISI
jgi:hypothetical protein